MINGYNRAVTAFNESAAVVADREDELTRYELETPIAWVNRFRSKYNRFPNPNYFRYAPPEKVYRRADSGSLRGGGSKSPKGKDFHTGTLASKTSINLANQKEQKQ